LLGAPGATHEAQEDLARTFNGTGTVLSYANRPSEAVAEYRKSVAVSQKLTHDNPKMLA